MRTTERHAQHVEEQARLAGADPVGPADLPPIPTAALDRASAAARHELDAREQIARSAREELEQSLADRDRACESAAAASESLGELLREVEQGTSRRNELTEELAAREEAARLARAAADTSTGVASASDGLDRALQRACRMVPLTHDSAPELMSALEGVESMACDLCIVEPGLTSAGPLDAGALSRWRSALARGDAPILAAADAMLAELEEIEAAWTACGAGDVSQDPLVVAARDHEARCRDAVEEVREHAATGAAGHDARVAIQAAHDHRVELEARGHKVDPAELELAIRGEHDALARVGFDSMLDFRIVMSGAGVGSLTAKRRQVVAADLAAATAEVERVQAARARHHRDLRERRAAVRGRAALELGLDEMQSIRVQLRRQLVVPAEVEELRQDWRRRAAGAAAAALEAAAVAEATTVAATESAGRLRHVEDELESLLRHVPPAQERVTHLDEAATTAERAVAAATAALEAAATAVDEIRASVADLQDAAPLDADIATHLEAVERIVVERLEQANDSGAPSVVLDDPLTELHADATLSLLDRLGRMDGVGPDTEVGIVLVTSRRELLHALRRSPARVHTVDSRRRHPRFGRRRAMAAASPSTG